METGNIRRQGRPGNEANKDCMWSCTLVEYIFAFRGGGGGPGNEASHTPWLNACSCIHTPLQIEVHLSCNLSTRQRRLYHGLRQRISIEDLLQSSTSQTASKDSSASHLLNLVMQFRKVREEEGSLCSLGLTRAIVLSPQVCNHPDLFERRDVKSPTFLPIPSFSIPQLLYHEALKLPVDRQR